MEGAGGEGEETGSRCLVWPTPTLLALLPEAAGVRGLRDARVPGAGENDEAYGRPPAQVEMVLQAVMILRGPEQLERPAGFPSSDKTRPDSPVPTPQGP